MKVARRAARATLGTVLLALGAAAPLAAQQVAMERVPALRAKIEQDLHRARFTLGPLRLIPILRVSDVGYTNNVLGTETDTQSDWTASATAGLGFVLPFGHNVFFWGEEAPTYNWYAHLVERRYLGGHYGGNLAVFLKRLTIDSGGGFSRTTNVYSAEQLQRIRQQEEDGHVNLELFLFERLGIVAGVEASQWRSQGDVAGDPATGQSFNSLDSDTYAGHAGLRYLFRGHLAVTAQVERTRQTYRFEGDLRDNETTAYLLGLGYDFPRFYINALAGYREGKSYNGSAFPTYHGATGSAFVSFSAGTSRARCSRTIRTSSKRAGTPGST